MDEANPIQAIAVALTGEPLPNPPDVAPNAAPAIAAWLVAAGWDGKRVRRYRAELLGRGGQWPHPIPVAQRGGLGAAQLTSAVHAVADQLGVAPQRLIPDPTATLNAADRRLIEDLPPHFGRL